LSAATNRYRYPDGDKPFEGDRMRRLIFAACLAGAPLLTSAQSMIYKVQMPDGSVLYSDSVPPGGKVLEEREVKSSPRVNTVPSLVPGRPPGKSVSGVARPTNSSDPMMRPAVPSKGGATPDNIPALERELAIAKRQLELGREPLPGERRGLAGGGSRLTPEYEARVAGMERDIAAIEAKLKSAYEKR
jgi:hypothetical protein